MSSEFGSIDVQIHLWPWSMAVGEETINLTEGNTEYPFWGSPIVSSSIQARLFLASRHEKFFQLGPTYASNIGLCRLFEAPHGSYEKKDQKGKLMVRGTNGHFFVNVCPKGAVEKDGNADDHGKYNLASTILSWSQFFDDILEESVQNEEYSDRVPWRNILEFVKKLSGEQSEPRRALIVKIAEDMAMRLPQTVTGLRKILVRERKLIPVSRLVETDRACLQWYIKQTGRNMAEKAGNQQKLMGITRKESHNVHENRILKDFLKRCSKESARYRKVEESVNSAYGETRRGQLVTSFDGLCRELSKAPVFHQISKPIPGTAPNYVLLNDFRYREIWKWYCKLLRHEDDEDRLWDWQSRTWADVSRLLVNAALVSHIKNPPNGHLITVEDIYQAALHIRREQSLGCRTLSGSEPGPFLIKQNKHGKTILRAVLEVVHPEIAEKNATGKFLGATGAHLYLILQPLNKIETVKKVLLIWAVNTAGSTCAPDFQSIATSAGRGLETLRTVMDSSRLALKIAITGIVLCSSLEAVEPDWYFTDDNRLIVIKLPAEPTRWLASVEWIVMALDEIIGGMI